MLRLFPSGLKEISNDVGPCGGGISYLTRMQKKKKGKFLRSYDFFDANAKEFLALTILALLPKVIIKGNGKQSGGCSWENDLLGHSAILFTL